MEAIGWEEYAVFLAVLAGSLAIGIYYGCFGTRQKSTKEFLLANREMSSGPVAISLLCSMISSIALMGYPMEIYSFGTQYLGVILCYIPLGLGLSYLYIPVYFNLNLSSAYEFAEIRFNKKLRLMISAFSIVHAITLMSVAVYTPSLAIELTTGINSRVSTAVICFVCIFYSALGGLKAVLWADVLQGFIMIGSLAVIAIKGAVEIGGIGEIWDKLEYTGRVQFLNFDPDPRTRHTVWTCLVGGYFVWLPTYAATQIQVQRFLSLPTISKARWAVFMNFIGLALVVVLCSLTGMVMVAKYYDCDPIRAKIVAKSDQLVPYFAEDTVGNVPGLLGLFVAGLTSASMSTMSSGLTALAAVMAYDFVKRLFPKLSDASLSNVSKVSTLFLGAITYLFIFAVEQMGSVLPAMTSLAGLLIGPTLGLFTLGMMFPPCTTKGAVLGMLTAIAFMAPFTIFQNVYRPDLINQAIPLSTHNCASSNSSLLSTTPPPPPNFYESHWKDQEHSLGIRLLSMSYMWHSGLTCSLTVFSGIIYSLIDRFVLKTKCKRINPKCISPCLLPIWKRLFPIFMKEILEHEMIHTISPVEVSTKQ